jgi:hypothetical protein
MEKLLALISEKNQYLSLVPKGDNANLWELLYSYHLAIVESYITTSDGSKADEAKMSALESFLNETWTIYTDPYMFNGCNGIISDATAHYRYQLYMLIKREQDNKRNGSWNQMCMDHMDVVKRHIMTARTIDDVAFHRLREFLRSVQTLIGRYRDC